jgi:2-C-methyl-D-erythritol 4-phosphate cytidylyltransferase
MRIGVIVLAAGLGKRLGAGTPKGFVDLAGRPIFSHCLAVFRGIREVADIILVVPPGSVDSTLKRHGGLLAAGGVTKVLAGGRRRQDSVERGLGMVSRGCDLVLVHDAARPFVTRELALAVARAAARTGAAVPGLPVRETVKQVARGRITATPDRSSLVAVQTPQGIRASLLRLAYARGMGRADATDDVQLVERLGRPVALVPGDPANLKITSREDLQTAEYLSDRTRGPGSYSIRRPSPRPGTAGGRRRSR